MRKAGGASRKRRAAERYSSPSPGPSTEPESPGFIPSHRDVRVPRATAQAAAHRLEKMASEFLPSVSPPTPQIPLALHHSPAAQGVAPEHSPIMEEAEEEEFVPIDQIPPLMLDPQARTEDVEMVVESKPEEPTFVTDFPPGLNYSGEQFGLRSTFFNPYTHIPTLPNVTLADLQEMQSEGLDRSYILERPLSPLEDAGYLGLQPPAVNTSICGHGWTTVHSMTTFSTIASMRRQRKHHHFSHDLTLPFFSSLPAFRRRRLDACLPGIVYFSLYHTP